MTLYARLRAHRRVLISDIDGTLLGGDNTADNAGAHQAAGTKAPERAKAPGKAPESTKALGARLLENRAALVLASGRNIGLTLEAVEELCAAGLPRPTALITGVGSEIYLCNDNPAGSNAAAGNDLDQEWAQHLAGGWDRDSVTAALLSVSGLVAQEAQGQGPLKASYYIDPSAAAPAAVVAAARAALSGAGLTAQLIHSAGNLLDVLPARASKGAAVAWLLARAAIDPHGAITAGDSGNDREMLLAEVDGVPLKGIVVAEHEPELADLARFGNVYFASLPAAGGVLEGLLAHGW